MCGDNGLYQFNSIARERFSEALERAAREQLERAERLFQEAVERGDIFYRPVTKALNPPEFMEG